jgi:HicB family
MNISAILDALRSDVETSAEGGDERTTEAVIRLGRLLEATVRVQIMDALSEAAAELSEEVPTGRVEVRIAGGDISLTFVRDQDEPTDLPVDEDSARITLRLPESIKTAAESSASQEGVSMNAWLVRAVKRALDERPRVRGHRVRGYAHS